MYFISDYLPGELLLPISGAKWKDTVILAHSEGYTWSCWLVPELQGLHFSTQCLVREPGLVPTELC